jgi:hypothetical protein
LEVQAPDTEMNELLYEAPTEMFVYRTAAPYCGRVSRHVLVFGPVDAYVVDPFVLLLPR